MAELLPLTDEELAHIRACIPNLSIGADDIRRMVAAVRRLPRPVADWRSMFKRYVGVVSFAEGGVDFLEEKGWPPEEWEVILALLKELEMEEQPEEQPAGRVLTGDAIMAPGGAGGYGRTGDNAHRPGGAVPVDEPKPLTDEELERIELYAAGDEKIAGMPGASFCTKPVDVQRLVAEVRQVRALVLKLETCGRRNPGCCMGHALLAATGQQEKR